MRGKTVYFLLSSVKLLLLFSLGFGVLTCGGPAGVDGQVSSGQTDMTLKLNWPDGYQYDPATARLYGLGAYTTG